MQRRLSVRLVTQIRAREMNEEAKRQKELLRMKTQKQLEYFDCANQKNQLWMKKTKQELESATLEQLSSLISLVEMHWDDGTSMDGVPYDKETFIEYLYTQEITGSERKVLWTLTKTLAGSDAINGPEILARGLRIACKVARRQEQQQIRNGNNRGIIQGIGNEDNNEGIDQ